MGKKVYDISCIRNVVSNGGYELVDCEAYIKELCYLIESANYNLKEFYFRNAKNTLKLGMELIEKNKKNKCGR